jgi:hypothetical protein
MTFTCESFQEMGVTGLGFILDEKSYEVVVRYQLTKMHLERMKQTERAEMRLSWG